MNIYGVNKVQQDLKNGGYYRKFLFRDITTGDNGDYSAGVGWDPVTGLGSFVQYLTPTTYAPSTSATSRTTSTTSTTTTTTSTTTSRTTTSSFTTKNTGMSTPVGTYC